LVCEDGIAVEVNNWSIPETNGAEAILRLENVQGAEVSRVNAAGTADAFVRVEGQNSRDIYISDNKIPGIKKTFEMTSDVRSKAVNVK